MSIEKIRELSIIKFPKSVDLREAEGLLIYLAENLPATINYRASHFMSLNGWGEKKYTLDYDGTTDIRGTIFAPKGGNATMDSFRFEHSTGTSKLKSIMFNLTPGLELPDYDIGARRMWDNTRNLVKQYFK